MLPSSELCLSLIKEAFGGETLDYRAFLYLPPEEGGTSRYDRIIKGDQALDIVDEARRVAAQCAGDPH